MPAGKDSDEARDRGRFFWSAFLVAFWALEVLAVQECTSQPDGVLYASDVVGFATRRLGFDILACLFLVCVLNRFWLYVVFGLGLIASNILVVCAEYFEAPLTWHVIRNQWAEGLAVADHGMSLIQRPALVLLLAALAIKVALRERLRRHLVPRPGLRRIGWAAGVAYLVFAVWLAGFHKPISKIRSGSPEYVYGYVIAWFAEATFFDDARLLRMAIEASQQRSDRLSPWESPLDLGDRLAIVQVESLDWDVIDARVGDEWVMPFLRDLRTRSMCYVIRPVHETGTSDADFTVLTGTMANGRIAPFKIIDFPYRDTLPQVARQRGYNCIAMHGNTGNFFFRRPAYERMGFSTIYFAEDLRDLGCEMQNGEVNDEALLRLSARWLRESSEPTVHFIITLTSHGPFHRLLPEDRELFPNPSCQAEAYLNSMRYVDRVLASYLEALPQGTVLVVYGDHESRVRGYGETPHAGERVPWLIHCKGKNLAERQRTRSMPWTQSGELQMLDAVTYLHKSLKEYRVAAHEPPSGKSDSVR